MIQWTKKMLCALVLMAWLVGFFPVVSIDSAPAFDPILVPAWFVLHGASFTPQVDPEVIQALATDSDIPLHLILIFPAPDLSANAALQSANALVRRTALVESMQNTYQIARAPFQTMLAEGQSRGEVLSQRDLWIIHGLALTAYPQFVRRLIETPGIAEIRLDAYTQYIPKSERAYAEASDETTPTWGLTSIRAPEVWSTLGISGTGAVVAIMDSGVDFLHPALSNRYYGNLGMGRFDHTVAWYDAVNGGTYPYDDYGHGTHVAGTAVGENNIGVAPGAQWMGVKVLDGSGSGYESWVHAGFQWILAPGGDPARSPDVVNASWGVPQSSYRGFETEIQTLWTADILPVFAAGNEGPAARSTRSPASLPGVFAVGADDEDGEVAFFSSRGPSPWDEIKPYIVAPGTNVHSSLPGGVYEKWNGTSMAAPHVVGIAALMRAVSPTISVATMARVLTETAVPLTTTTPNNNSGWGHLDAFAALVVVAHPGLITGTVRGAGEGGVLPDALIQASSRGAMPIVQTHTDAQGHYTLALLPGLYDISVAAFGYQVQMHDHLRVLDNDRQTLDFDLLALPSGVLQGKVTVLGNGLPPTRATSITVIDTPLSSLVDQNGNYQFTLPSGTYELEVRGLGYRCITYTVTVFEGQMTIYNVVLSTIPTILLVDEGAWYYGSRIQYWREALDSIAFTYDEIRIKHPATETPISTTLARYDIVLWSSPTRSPGAVAGDDALKEYLDQGGRLFLSGNDVAYYDMGKYKWYEYLFNRMNVVYLGDVLYPVSISGLGPFAGLTMTLQARDDSTGLAHANQVQVMNSEKAQIMWQYDNGSGAAVGTSTCVPYRSLMLSFGYETIDSLEQRCEVLMRSIDWLLQPPDTTGLALSQMSAPTAIGSPGETVTHLLRLRHTGYAGTPDHVTLSLDSGHWPATILPHTAVVSPCAWITLTVVVTIPENSTIDIADIATVTVHSSQVSYPLTYAVRTKTPATVLLVDDDRWYQMEGLYIAALQSRHIPFDVWDTDHAKSGIEEASAPTLAVLQKYPMVIWYNGYDWYHPILSIEAVRLGGYLQGGGRLLLSSQEFLYAHPESSLIPLLGVGSWHEDRHPTWVSGIPGHPVGGQWGWDKLDYPFPNWSDTIEPLPGAVPLIRNIAGQPLAVANVQVEERSKTVFAGFPLETLPLATQAEFLANAVGWFSPLGDSTWELSPATPHVGGQVTGTVVLHNDAPSSHSVALSHTLPSELSLLSIQDNLLHYNALSRVISWDGVVPPNTSLTLTWVMTVVNDSVRMLTPTVELTLPDWKLSFERKAFLHIAGSHLAGSWQYTASDLQAGEPVSLAFTVRNTGVGAATGIRVGAWLMEGLAPLTQTVPPTRGLLLPSLWQGNLDPGETYTVIVPVRAWIGQTPVRVDALVEDADKIRWEERLWLTFDSWKIYLPLILRGPSN
ncbi:MAG: S8 family serine peptidase [Anaerolineae bacterium]|nr:S8 family serine peptidase [Anaerolineae bacterium]